jgi:hypothetical protein
LNSPSRIGSLAFAASEHICASGSEPWLMLWGHYSIQSVTMNDAPTWASD